MGELFFTSDLHFGHDNIIEYCKRPWKTVDEMNEALIENFNARVTKRDEVWILGDFSFKMKKEDAKKTLLRLNGNKHLIIGNHDIKWERLGGFSSTRHLGKITREGTSCILCHYPLLEWDGDGKGAYMLHGHAHYESVYNLRQRELGIRRYDVGVDANYYAPVALDEIINFFKGVEPKRPWPQALLPWNETPGYAHG